LHAKNVELRNKLSALKTLMQQSPRLDLPESVEKAIKDPQAIQDLVLLSTLQKEN
jgi:predicted component of type VI protein secretion system